MEVRLKQYKNERNYRDDYPESIEFFESVNKAVDFCRKRVSKYRGTEKFIAFKIFDKHGKLIHKLPSR